MPLCLRCPRPDESRNPQIPSDGARCPTAEEQHPPVQAPARDPNAFLQLLVDPKCGKIFLLCRLKFPPKVKSFFLIRFAANLGFVRATHWTLKWRVGVLC